MMFFRAKLPDSVNAMSQLPLAIDTDDPRDAERLLPLVYEELRKLAAHHIARENPGLTIQATALVHEAYLRLVGSEDPGWDGRAHFFAAAARSMRQILVDRARSKQAEKNGGGRAHVEILDTHPAFDTPPDEILAVDEALDRLAEEDPRAAEIVKLRYFAGLSVEEAAKVIGISRADAYRHWTYARAWVRCHVLGGK